MRPKALYKEIYIKKPKNGMVPHSWLTFGRLDYPLKGVTMQVTPSNPWNSSYNNIEGSLDGENWFDLSGGNFWFDPNQNGGAFTISTFYINRPISFIRVGTHVVTAVGELDWSEGKVSARVDFA